MTYNSRVYSAPGFPKQMQYNIRNYSFKKIYADFAADSGFPGVRSKDRFGKNESATILCTFSPCCLNVNENLLNLI